MLRDLEEGREPEVLWGKSRCGWSAEGPGGRVGRGPAGGLVSQRSHGKVRSNWSKDYKLGRPLGPPRGHPGGLGTRREQLLSAVAPVTCGILSKPLVI